MPQSYENGVPPSAFSKLENQIKVGAVGSGQEAEVRFLHSGIGFESFFVKEKKVSQRVIVYCLTRQGQGRPLVLPLSAYRKCIDACKMACRHDRPWDLTSGPWFIIGVTGQGIDTRYQILVREVFAIPQEKAEAIRKFEQQAMDYACGEEKWKEKQNVNVNTSTQSQSQAAVFLPQPVATPVTPASVAAPVAPNSDLMNW